MLKYTSKKMKQKLKENDINALNQVQKKKSGKFKQTLKFMTEWSNDLLQRQHDLWKNQEELNQELCNLQIKSKTFRSQKTQQTSRNLIPQKGIDIQKIIEEELISKIQQVYSKQILMYETNQMINRTYNSQQSSHIQSRKSQKSLQKEGQMSSNFSNYFNGYQCNTESKKNCEESINTESLSKASQLIQQKYHSNSIQEEQQRDYYEQQINPRHLQTYQQNFISF